MIDDLIGGLADATWSDSREKRSHEGRMQQMQREGSGLWKSINSLEAEIREKKKAVREHEDRKQRHRRYQTDCQKFDFLATRDLQAARELLSRIHRRHGQFVRNDHAFEQRVKRFLDAETREFQRRLDGVVI